MIGQTPHTMESEERYRGLDLSSSESDEAVTLNIAEESESSNAEADGSASILLDLEAPELAQIAPSHAMPQNTLKQPQRKRDEKVLKRNGVLENE